MRHETAITVFPQQIVNLGKQAKLRVKQEYCWDNIALQFETLYERLINRFQYSSNRKSQYQLQIKE